MDTKRPTTNGIVVGVDGSTPARSALRWAAAEAARRHVPLRIVAAYGWQWPTEASVYSGGTDAALRATYETIVKEAEAEAGAVLDAAGAGRGEVTGVAVEGDAAAVLLEAGRDADLTVVGNRGHGGFGSLLLGSVSQRVATHATGPVVVVRGRGDTAAGPVIVGVDGSESADSALGIAFEEAQRRGCALIAIQSYTVPVSLWPVPAPPLTYDPEEIGQATSAALDGAVAGWRRMYPAVPVETLVGRGSAAKVLTDTSASASLVVIGSRGHGSITGTLLGSVGLQLLHHADCPVLVARS